MVKEEISPYAVSYGGADIVPFIGNRVVGELQSIRICDLNPETFNLGGPYRVMVLLTAVYLDSDPLTRELGLEGAGELEDFNITICMANERRVGLARRVAGCKIIHTSSGMAVDDVCFEVTYLIAARSTYYMPPFVPSQLKGLAVQGMMPKAWPEIDLTQEPVKYDKPLEPVNIEDSPLRRAAKWAEAHDPTVELTGLRALRVNLRNIWRRLFRVQPTIVSHTEVVTPDPPLSIGEMIRILRMLNK